MPEGAFRIGVARGEALHVVDEAFEVSGGLRSVDIVVDPEARAAAGTAPAGARAGLWSNPITSALLVIGGAILVGVAVESFDSDDEDEATGTN